MAGDASANEVDNFQPITVGESSFSPAISRDNVAIQFHGHAVGLHAEAFQERRKSKERRRIAELALFPIDLKFHKVVCGGANLSKRVARLGNYPARCRANLRVAVRPS
jgi:hypothetical protein